MVFECEPYRQDGFYVDYVDGVRSPLSMTEKQFTEFKNRITNFKSFTKEFISTLKVEGNDIEVFKQQVIKLQETFIKENYYQKIGELVTNLNKREYDGFSILAESLKGATGQLLKDYKDEKSIF